MQKKLTVSQLNNYISGVFDDEYVLHDITVEGEISELSQSGGRTFLTLKESECQLSCVCFNRIADVQSGMSVEATGSISFYKKTGRLSFIIKEIVPRGEGLQYLELMKLKAKLQAEGLFENKPPLPEKIRKITVITSETGAVIHDIISVIRTKDMMLDIAVCDVHVQGAESAAEIAGALKLINRHTFGTDVIIIARGGGSAADLQAYNTEAVARAVAGSKLPIISAVGHETDYTLCDLCATARAGTPSIAADMVSSPLSDKIDRLLSLTAVLYQRLSRKYAYAESRVNYDSARIIGKTELIMQKRGDYVTGLCRNIHDALAEKYSADNERIKSLAAVLDRLSPLKVLARGYSKIVKGGKEISSVKELKSGDGVDIVFKDGKKSAEIK